MYSKALRVFQLLLQRNSFDLLQELKANTLAYLSAITHVCNVQLHNFIIIYYYY